MREFIYTVSFILIVSFVILYIENPTEVLPQKTAKDSSISSEAHYDEAMFIDAYAPLNHPIPDYATEKYASYADIPQELIFKYAISFESYMAPRSHPLKIAIDPFKEINEASLQAYLDRKIERSQKGRLSYDVDKDGFVTRQEIMDRVIKGQSKYKKNLLPLNKVSKHMLLDTNDDNVLSYSELKVHTDEDIKQAKSREWLRAKAVLSLDPNKDGTLTKQEVDMLLIKAFATVDINGDRRISDQEALRLTQALKYAKINQTHSQAKAKQKAKLTSRCYSKNAEIPDGLKVYAYKSMRDSGTELHLKMETGTAKQDKNQAIWQSDIIVNSPDAPVALVLWSAKPRIWNIQYTKETIIHSVHASGEKTQIITGVKNTVPQAVHTYENRDSCASRYSFKDSHFSRLGLPRSEVHLTQENGTTLIGQPYYNKNDLQHSGFQLKDAYKLGTAFTPPMSFKRAFKEGYLRKLTREEETKHFGSYINNTYMVLKPFTFSERMIREAGYYIVPKGVEPPKHGKYREHAFQSPIFKIIDLNKESP